jgi:zinc finger protein CreA/MIG
MEIADPYHANGGAVPSKPSTGMRLGDIINRPEGAQRKPPVARLAVHDLLNSTAAGGGG